jgi:hypothetical protein
LRVTISLFLYIKLTIIDSTAEAESEAESPSLESPPAEFSDWDGFSDTLSFDSASDAFTDNHTDSEPEGIDTSWLYTTVEEQDKDAARRRYLRRRNRHIQERDRRRLAKELKEVDFFQFDDDNALFDTWTTFEQDQDQIQDQILAEIQGQELDLRLDQDTGDQDTRPQKRQYSSEALEFTDPEPRERRYPLRKRQLTAKAAALIIE